MKIEHDDRTPLNPVAYRSSHLTSNRGPDCPALRCLSLNNDNASCVPLPSACHPARPADTARQRPRDSSHPSGPFDVGLFEEPHPSSKKQAVRKTNNHLLFLPSPPLSSIYLHRHNHRHNLALPGYRSQITTWRIAPTVDDKRQTANGEQQTNSRMFET